MKVESIAECCNTFDLHSLIIGLENLFVVFLRVAVLHRFYCIMLSASAVIEMSYFQARIPPTNINRFSNTFDPAIK